jgi:Cdc6-like AAA superfamily ATPase
MSSEYPSLSRTFGFDREKKIADSGIRNLFTPHQPIAESDLLFGRTPEVATIIQSLNTPGQHVLLYGERGVGKSSLANVTADLVLVLSHRRMFVKRCDASDTFESIVKGPLAAIGADLSLISVTEQNDKDGGIDFKLFKAGIAQSIVSTYAASHSLSPSTVAEAIGDIQGLLVVDEADAIGNPEDRRKLAELVKLLSDAGATFKVMIVGIAETGGELTAAHPSVQRCLREVKINRMSASELREIVVTGSAKAGLVFTPKVLDAIVRYSAGYPHFTHLIALKCAEDAIAEDRTEIEPSHMVRALVGAVDDAEATLKAEYESAVRSASTGMYKQIVHAAASFGPDEFTAAQLRDAIAKATGETISQGSLNNFLSRLVSDDGSTIFRREAKGIYRFSDPRLASYALIFKSIADAESARELT